MSVSPDDAQVEALVLNIAYDAGGTIAYDELHRRARAALSVPRRKVWRAVYAQHSIGNIKRHRNGEPIALTASARAAIAAGRQAAA